MNLTADEAVQFGLLPIVLWKEARNQTRDAMVAVAWVVKNRVNDPKWWGWDYPTVILKHYKGIYQFSSFDENDPNSTNFAKGNEPAWHLCVDAASAVFTNSEPDPTNGATMYFDKSIDNNPPKWAVTLTKTADIGDFHFYK